MNRRNFLKSFGIACATAVVAPATLLKSKSPQDETGKWYDYPLSPAQRWPTFYNEPNWPPNEEFLEKFRKAFNDTKFKPPVYFKENLPA